MRNMSKEEKIIFLVPDNRNTPAGESLRGYS